jgi:hypothetical protein
MKHEIRMNACVHACTAMAMAIVVVMVMVIVGGVHRGAVLLVRVVAMYGESVID